LEVPEQSHAIEDRAFLKVLGVVAVVVTGVEICTSFVQLSVWSGERRKRCTRMAMKNRSTAESVTTDALRMNTLAKLFAEPLVDLRCPRVVCLQLTNSPERPELGLYGFSSGGRCYAAMTSEGLQLMM
jgi:hypothetical protein